MSCGSSGATNASGPSIAPDEGAETSIEGLFLTFAFSAGVGLFFFSFFVLQRERVPEIYNFRPLRTKEGVSKPFSPGSSLGWITELIRVSDDDLMETAGLDALMMVRSMRLGMKLFLVISAISLPVLLPVYATASGGLEGLDGISLSNVEVGSPRLWATAISVMLTSVWALTLVVWEWKDYVKLRQRYFRTTRERTVQVCDVPNLANSGTSTRLGISSFYTGLVGQVSVVHVALKTPRLDKLVEQREKQARALERVLFDLHRAKNQKKKKRPVIRVGARCRCFGGAKADAERYLRQDVERLNNEVLTAQREVKKRGSEEGCAAFVTFVSPRSATVAVQCIPCSDPLSWSSTIAPEPDDILWHNMGMRYEQRKLRRWLGFAVTGALVVFWTIPVAFVSALTKLESLSDSQWLSWIVTIINIHPMLRGFVEGLLPTLALVIFMALLPTILTKLGEFEGRTSFSDVESSVFRKLFVFQVVNVFGVTLVAGSLFDEINCLVEKPTTILDILSVSIPKTGNLFTNYVMLNALGVFTGSLAQVFRFGKVKLLLALFTYTRRQRETLFAAPSYDYGGEVASHLLILLVGLVYSASTPIISAFALVFFCVGYIVLKQQLLFVYEKAYERGGTLWPDISTRIGVILVIYQLTMVALLGVKESPAAPIALPLPFITMLTLRHCQEVYRPRTLHMPLNQGASLDAMNQIRPGKSRSARLAKSASRSSSRRKVSKNETLAQQSAKDESEEKYAKPSMRTGRFVITVPRFESVPPRVDLVENLDDKEEFEVVWKGPFQKKWFNKDIQEQNEYLDGVGGGAKASKPAPVDVRIVPRQTSSENEEFGEKRSSRNNVFVDIEGGHNANELSFEQRAARDDYLSRRSRENQFAMRIG